MSDRLPRKAQVLSLVPMAQVSDVPRSIAFYEKLGFKVDNSFTPEGQEAPTWAWLESEKAMLMVTRAAADLIAGAKGVLFYMYCEDVPQCRDALVERGIDCGGIGYPFYAPQGEFKIVDPDGHTLMITHI